MAKKLTRRLTPPDGPIQGLVKVPEIGDPSALNWVTVWFHPGEGVTRPLACFPIRFYNDAGFSHFSELSVVRLRLFDRFNSPTFINLKFDWLMVNPV